MRKHSTRLATGLVLAFVLSPPTPAWAAPRLEYSPARFDVEALAGAGASSTLSLRNVGDAVLDVTLTVLDGRLSAARRVRPAASVSGPRTPDDPPPGGDVARPPRSAAPWANGPGLAVAIPPTPAPRVTESAFRILLLHSRGDVGPLRAQLAAFREFAAVDVWDLTVAEVPLDVLLGYGAVLLAVNSAIFEPNLLGDALADYVDAGGGVVLTLASFVSGYEVGGRLLLEAYAPFLLASGSRSRADLGTYDAAHPIMSAVSTLHGELITDPLLAPGARLVSSWSDGRALVATRPGVVGINLFAALPGYASGDVPVLLRNALLWSAGRSPWLRPASTRIAVPPGGESLVELAFDASDLNAGAYEADVLLTHDDPTQLEMRIPTRFVVHGEPRMELSGGEGLLESVKVFGLQGEETSHRFVVGSPAPDTIRLELLVEGDFGDGGEIATVAVEGVTVGGAGQVGVDCKPARRTFTLLPQLVRRLLTDGVVDATVRNTALVDPLCLTNRHTVRLRYERPADPIETGAVFVGASGGGSLHIRNAGTDMLVVGSIRSSDAAFASDRDSLSVAPGHTASVRIRFSPGLVGEALASLAFSSNDPRAPVVELRLHGEGLAPPDVDVQPSEVGADLHVGGLATRTVELRNLGASPLQYRLRARSSIRAGPLPRGGPAGRFGAGRSALPLDPFPAAPLPPEEGARAAGESPVPETDPSLSESMSHPRSDERAALAMRPATPAAMPGARVLILQDVQPWSTLSNETVLSGEGVAFERAPSSALDTLDLGRFALVILAGDQTDLTYSRLRDHAEQLEDFVGAGGVLEVHAAGWGLSGGDASQLVLPGRVSVQQKTSDFNHVMLPAHPLVEGVLLSIPGTSASHAWFSGLPASAEVVARDDFDFPVLTVYALGHGMVVASGQTLEFAFANGQAAGPILENMIRYSLAGTPQWLSCSPASGVIPPGGAQPVTLTFDATNLDGGAYAGELLVVSDDPDEPIRDVLASLRVTGAPALDVTGRVVIAESRTSYVVSGALTTHRLAIDRPPDSFLAIELEVTGDFDEPGEDAALSVEGFTLGAVGQLGRACASGRRVFVLPSSFADRVLADGVLEIDVVNSALVGVRCPRNEHRVRVSHMESPFPLRFKDTFSGACDRRSFLVGNRGTEPLTIHSIAVAPAAMRASPASFTIAPRHEQVVSVEFCPDAPGFVQGQLTLASDDPDTPSASLLLYGTARPAPVLALAAEAISADLLAGERASRSFQVRNTGGSPLELRFLARAGLREPAAPAPFALPGLAGPSSPGGPGPRADARAAATPLLPPLASQAAARVLIVEDLPPWGRLTDETLLDEMGVPYDRVPASGVAGTDLSRYSVVLIAGDQGTFFYAVLSGQAARIAAYVEDGGTLEAHLSGWGSNLGDASFLALPAGVGARLRLSDLNHVALPAHPLLAGVPDPFTGTFASHGYLAGLPAGSLALATDPDGGVTLAEYTFGAGRVLVGTQPFEYGVVASQPAGTILRNLLPYALSGAGGWLGVSERRATLAPGDSLRVEATLETALLRPGAYAGEIQVTSNDPRGAFHSVPAELRVANVPVTFRIGQPGLSRERGAGTLAVALTLPAGHDAASVRLATVRLNGVPADTGRGRVEREDDDDAGSGGAALRGGDDDDERRDGARGLRLRFDREAVRRTLGPGPEAVLLLAGALAGEDRFLGRDSLALATGKRDDDDDDDAVAGGAPGRAGARTPPAAAALRLGPNPSTGGPLRLELAMPRAGLARVDVFSLDGRLVRALGSGEREAGVHLLAWDGRDGAGRAVAAGVYLVRVRIPGLEAVRRVIRM